MKFMDAEITIYDLLTLIGFLIGALKIFLNQDKKIGALETKTDLQEKTIAQLRASKSSSIERMRIEMKEKEDRIYKDMEKLEERHDNEFKEIKRQLEELPQRIAALLKK